METVIIFDRQFNEKDCTRLKSVRIHMHFGPYISHNSLNTCFGSIPSIAQNFMYPHKFQTFHPCYKLVVNWPMNVIAGISNFKSNWYEINKCIKL